MSNFIKQHSTIFIRTHLFEIVLNITTYENVMFKSPLQSLNNCSGSLFEILQMTFYYYFSGFAILRVYVLQDGLWMLVGSSIFRNVKRVFAMSFMCVKRTVLCSCSSYNGLHLGFSREQRKCPFSTSKTVISCFITTVNCIQL